jgi:16S rRNA (uracil1498-N3)-methyltransferase
VRVSAHAFVVDLDAPVLDDDDRHHLERVLRLAPGEALTVSDGAGRWRTCRFGPTIDPTSDVTIDVRPAPPITIAFALVKGDRPDWIVQKLTELGADVIVPFRGERSVVRWDPGRADHHRARWATVARQAAMQSRRTFLPVVEAVVDHAAVAALPSATRAEPGGQPVSLARPTVLIGPEGGWSAAELSVDLPTVGLGPHVLRSETAAVAACALLAALRAGFLTGHHAP